MPRLATRPIDKGIGASEVPMLLGLSSYGGPHDVWRIRIEGEPPREETINQWLGHELETVIARLVTDRFGIRLRNRTETVWHPDGVPLFAHIDRKVEGERTVVEIKSSGFERDWGEPGDENAVPPAVRAQVAAQLACTDYDDALVVVLIGGREPRLYRLERDRDLEAAIVEAVVDLWGYVERREPPPVDGSEGAAGYLRRRFPHDEGETIVATVEQRLLVDELRLAIAAEKAAKARHELAEQRIQELMGTASVLLAPEGRITWRTEAPRAEWKAIAEAIAATAGLEVAPFVAANTEQRVGRRVIRTSFPKSERSAA